MFTLGQAHPLPCFEWEQMTSSDLPDLNYTGSLEYAQRCQEVNTRSVNVVIRTYCV